MSRPNSLKLEDQVDAAWRDYSLDAPQIPNPIPEHTQGLRRMCMVTHLILPTTKCLIGLAYLNLCPTNPWLPTYLIVGGALQIAFLIVLIYKKLRQPVLLAALGCALLIWGLIASVNIIVEWKPDFFRGGWRYCHKIFFYFAFLTSVLEYIILGLVVLYVCTAYAYSKEPANVPENQIV